MNLSKRKGRMMYVPPNVINEVENIMANKGLKKRSQGFDRMLKYTKVGREAERIYTLDFSDLGLFKKGRRK